MNALARNHLKAIIMGLGIEAALKEIQEMSQNMGQEEPAPAPAPTTVTKGAHKGPGRQRATAPHPKSAMARVAALVADRAKRGLFTTTEDVVNAGIPYQTIFNAAKHGYVRSNGNGIFTKVGG
jgi:hypothetical protein